MFTLAPDFTMEEIWGAPPLTVRARYALRATTPLVGLDSLTKARLPKESSDLKALRVVLYPRSPEVGSSDRASLMQFAHARPSDVHVGAGFHDGRDMGSAAAHRARSICFEGYHSVSRAGFIDQSAPAKGILRSEGSAGCFVSQES